MRSRSISATRHSPAGLSRAGAAVPGPRLSKAPFGSGTMRRRPAGLRRCTGPRARAEAANEEQRMTIEYRAAVLHSIGEPMTVEPVTAGRLGRNDVLVRIKAAGLCHTDLEVITGSLRYPLPIVLGHEVAGVVEEVGPEARGIVVGDHVVLSWNPHCGHCFYCDRDLPILCEQYLGAGPKGLSFGGESRNSLADGR